jgi:hypothetical protein
MRRVASLGAVIALVFGVIAMNPGKAAAATFGPWLFNPDTGHAYTQINDMDWASAEAYAEGLGGYLVTINDQDEQDWLASTFTDQDLSIGYTDAAEEGTWVWTSGEDPGYTDWAPGEPNNSDGNENVAVMNAWGTTDQWNDVNDNWSAIAEIPGPFAPNDLLADAQAMPENVNDDAPDMSMTSFEAGEPVCDTGNLQGSVWYAFWNAAPSGALIEIDGDQDLVTAGVYGPFDSFPPSMEDVAANQYGCIYGVGWDSAWTEPLERGYWLVQLASSHEWTSQPTIHVERNFAWFWIDSESIQVTSASVDKAGNINIEGTADCQLQWWDPGYGQAWFSGDFHGDGFYGYGMSVQLSQALGRKTLLTGDGGGYINCTDNHWYVSARANNGKFGPNLTNVDVQIGADQCDENGCWFNSFVGISDYVKVTKAH